MNSNLIIAKIYQLLEFYLANKIPTQELVYRFEDLYYFEVEPLIKEEKLDDNLAKVFEDYFEEINLYEPNPEAVIQGYKNDDQIYEATKNLKQKIDDYILESKVKLNFSPENNLHKEVSFLVGLLIHQINEILYFQKEGKEIIPELEIFFEKIKEIEAKNDEEFQLEQDMAKIFDLLKEISSQSYQETDEPLSRADPFRLQLNEMKKRLYTYLNPEIKEEIK